MNNDSPDQYWVTFDQEIQPKKKKTIWFLWVLSSWNEIEFLAMSRIIQD